jgi:hypothetical protein
MFSDFVELFDGDRKHGGGPWCVSSERLNGALETGLETQYVHGIIVVLSEVGHLS